MPYYQLKPHWDAFTLCEAQKSPNWTPFMLIHVTILTFFACFAAFGLTTFVQSVVSLKTRIAMMKLSHCLGGFLWMLAITVCTPWTFPLIVANTYLWGSEPYDNVFSVDMWRVSLALARKGVWMHVYWAISSLFLHVWFVGGAATLTLGVERPEWIVIAIVGFVSSHIARLFAYEYRDVAASILEIVGVLLLTVCLVIEAMDWSTATGVWLTVSVFERWTHIPAAVRGDAGWMRSYDLWLAAVREVPSTSPDDPELHSADSSGNLMCVSCRRNSFTPPDSTKAAVSV